MSALYIMCVLFFAFFKKIYMKKKIVFSVDFLILGDEQYYTNRVRKMEN